MILDAIVEIPMGSFYKYELNKDNQLVLDRPLTKMIPSNYGHIPKTLSQDEDPLDIFIISKFPILPKTKVKVKVLYGYKCTDNEIEDNKLIGILQNEEMDGTSIGEQAERIENYLNTYKPGFKIIEKVDEFDAIQIANICHYIFHEGNYV